MSIAFGRGGRVEHYHGWTLYFCRRSLSAGAGLIAADAQLCQALRLMHQHYQQPWQIATLAQIAHEVGYGSETALSKAFKRVFGVGVRVITSW